MTMLYEENRVYYLDDAEPSQLRLEDEIDRIIDRMREDELEPMEGLMEMVRAIEE